MSQTIQATHRVNGVDVDRLTDTLNAVKSQPDLANFKFRASNKWFDGAHNRSTIQGFFGVGAEDETRTEPFVLDADEPDVLLGEDKGANPVEYLLHALAACMTTTMAVHAAARGIKIESIESELEGDIDLQGFLGLDPDIRPGYQDIRVRFKVKSDAEASQLEELLAYSPVHNSVAQPVNVDASVEVIR